MEGKVADGEMGDPGLREHCHLLPFRLARSTLTLVPLLGVHEVVFAPVTEEQARGTLRFAKLCFEIFLSSFQVLRRGAGATPLDLESSPEGQEGYSPLIQAVYGV